MNMILVADEMFWVVISSDGIRGGGVRVRELVGLPKFCLTKERILDLF